MSLELLIYDLLMNGMPIRHLIIWIISVYIVLRFLFIFIARVYLNRYLTIEQDNEKERKIQTFFVNMLDAPLLIYHSYIVYSIFNGNFMINYLKWYGLIMVAIIVIEGITGVVRKSYVNRVNREREYLIELEKFKRKQDYNV